METATHSQPRTKLFLISGMWFMSLLVVGFVGYFIGEKGLPEKSVLNAKAVHPSPTPIPTANPQNALDTTYYNLSSDTITQGPQKEETSENTVCKKTGFAQKWEYLTAYEVEENDTLQSIAKKQLNDEGRVNEILQVNGVGPLVVGYTLYLPPPNVPKSSGNLKQVYGKLLKKSQASWHIGFSSDPDGQGILIPAFLFENIADRDDYMSGDCLKIFFDDGYTVYSVARQ